ncbi:hypothetical protein F5050DRAFT_1890944 [Lentinula boryana]|uniref:Uncharacterized protein n=1 Tax=Lentinula boryana TaxID=40481 RepID=A0ABQ8QSX8_9AGAR|nr:hypothetical protein F5050DRAFT_1890944 [Lentinula boryana]
MLNSNLKLISGYIEFSTNFPSMTLGELPETIIPMTFEKPPIVKDVDASVGRSLLYRPPRSLSIRLPVECPSIVTPHKPCIQPVVSSSIMSPVELLPSLASTAARLSHRLDSTEKSLFPSLDIWPLVVDIPFSLSLMTPIPHLNPESDLHVGYARAQGEVIDTPPLRTPFHPNSPPSSPDTPVRFDLSAFPVFDARTGPTGNNGPINRPLLTRTRPALCRETALDLAASVDGSPEVSPSVSYRKAPILRRSIVYRPLKMLQRNSTCILSSIPETSSTPQRTTGCSPSVQIPSHSSRLFARCSLKLNKQSSVPVAMDNNSSTSASASSLAYATNTLQPRPYDSNDTRSKSGRPTLVPGFLQSLPPFELPTTPLSASPITISPVNPSRCATPLKSPFLIRRKDEGLKWRSDSSEYFSNMPV